MSPDAALTAELLEGRDAFNALEKEWNLALAKGPRDEPMLRHEWARAFLENFAASAVLRTFVVRSGKELHAAMPLVESKDRSADTCFVTMTTWATPTNDHSQRGGILLGRRGAESLPLLWQKLLETQGWDRLRVRDLPQGAAEWKLRELAGRAGFPEGTWTSLRSPYLPLPELPKPALVPEPAKASSGPEAPVQAGGNPDAPAQPSAGPEAPAESPLADRTRPRTQKPQKQKQPGPNLAVAQPGRFEHVLGRLDAKFRANLRRRRRRLAEQGEVKYVQLDGKDAAKLDLGLADFFTIEASGWKGKGGTAIAQRPELVGFYTQIARDAAKRGALSLGFLELSGKRIAAHLSILHAGRHFLLKLGYDEAFAEFSPGQQLVHDAIEDACKRGLLEFDFLGPFMEWKADWETGFRSHAWLTIFRPTQKAVLVAGARFTAWPIARSLLGRARERVLSLRKEL